LWPVIWLSKLASVIILKEVVAVSDRSMPWFFNRQFVTKTIFNIL